MKEMVTHYVFEKKVPGSVVPEVVDAMAMLTSKINGVVDDYERRVKNLGRYRADSYGAGRSLRDIGDMVLSLVAATVARQIDDACRRLERMDCAAAFEESKSAIVLSEGRESDSIKLSSHVWFHGKDDGMCVAVLDFWCKPEPDIHAEVQRVVINAASFDEAYDFVMAHEDELNNEMRELLQAKYAELVRVA